VGVLSISYFYIVLFQFRSVVINLFFRFWRLVVFLNCFILLLSFIRVRDCLIWKVISRFIFILRIRFNYFRFVWCLIAWIYFWISVVFFNFGIILNIFIFVLRRIILIFSLILRYHRCWLIFLFSVILFCVVANYARLIFSRNAIIVFLFY